MARRLASPEAKVEGGGEGAERDERIRMLEAGHAAERWPSATRGSGCSRPTGPPWTATTRGLPQATGTTTALTPRREAARGRPGTAGERRSRRAMRGRQSGGRRAGAGSTSARRSSWTQTALTSTAAAPSSAASATAPACPSAFAKQQVAYIEEVVVSRRNVVMHYMTCNDCGAAVDASRAGTMRGTCMSPKMIRGLWNIGCDTHCSLEMLALVCRYLLGLPVARAAATAAAANDAANDKIAWPAGAIRQSVGAASRGASGGCRGAMPAGRTDHAIAKGGGEKAPAGAHAAEAVSEEPRPRPRRPRRCRRPARTPQRQYRKSRVRGGPRRRPGHRPQGGRRPRLCRG